MTTVIGTVDLGTINVHNHPNGNIIVNGKTFSMTSDSAKDILHRFNEKSAQDGGVVASQDSNGFLVLTADGPIVIGGDAQVLSALGL